MTETSTSNVIPAGPGEAIPPLDKRTASPPAYFSCRDMHAYYGESYIVQGIRFNVH
jgi:hypothetical protein